MREVPKVESADRDVIVTEVEFRRRRDGGQDQGDWYVTWSTRARPWEISVMRLPCSEHAGRAWHHGRFVDYRVCWQWQDVHKDQRLRSGGGQGSGGRPGRVLSPTPSRSVSHRTNPSLGRSLSA